MPRAHPILFTSENVRAILQGRKTQTRRMMKPQPVPIPEGSSVAGAVYTSGWFEGKAVPDYVVKACPYGMPGDRLWVRETWAWPGEEQVLYKANPDDAALVERWKTDPNCPQVKWTPSIHMPKKFCRLWLELTEVRVERLQDCSEEDAIAEGMVRSLHFGKAGIHRTAQEAYRSLWESINGAGSWAANPYVWVLSFQPTKGARG